MSTKWTLDDAETEHAVYRGEDYMKKVCEFLREHAMKMINFEKLINKQTAGIV